MEVIQGVWKIVYIPKKGGKNMKLEILTMARV